MISRLTYPAAKKAATPIGVPSQGSCFEVAITSSKGHETGVTMMATPVFLICLDFGVQNPMLVISVDKDASPPHPTSFRSATFPSRERLYSALAVSQQGRICHADSVKSIQYLSRYTSRSFKYTVDSYSPPLFKMVFLLPSFP